MTGKHKDETKLVHAGRNPKAQYGAVNPPVIRASTIIFDTVAELDQANQSKSRHKLTYGRRGTPTSWALSDAICELEGGFDTVLTPSGLSAVTLTLTAFSKAGGHILISDNIYNPSRHFADTVLKQMGVETTYFDPMIGPGITGLIKPNTTLILCESPGSLTFEVQDVPAFVAAAKPQGITVAIDNTWATPLLFKPLAMGVDVVVHSGTKYIVGHADALIGCATANERSWKQLNDTHGNLGLSVGPDDIYLAQRGLRTLGVRLAHQGQAAMKIGTWLKSRPEVGRILHPAFPDCPGHALWQRDFLGASGLFGVELKDQYPKEKVAAFLDGLELFGMGYSWGGYESLIIQAKPWNHRTATQWTSRKDLFRISVGLEAVDDLIADLEAGLARLHA